ncbi:MAG: hypothetical protein JWN82_476 [Candidatus Saccharibacteria bacterium]|nr:hypothetical protein [Candidatus Saccharibacteria bacterium]
MVKRAEQYYVEQNRVVFDMTTGDLVDPHEFNSRAELRRVRAATCAAACSSRALIGEGQLLVQCFPAPLSSEEAAEAKEKLCMQTQERTWASVIPEDSYLA